MLGGRFVTCQLPEMNLKKYNLAHWAGNKPALQYRSLMGYL